MSNPTTETRSAVVEREFPHAPEKVWRALTQQHLIQEWLMKNDFKPVVDHKFTLSGDWGHADCRVTEIEPNKSLVYTWDAFGGSTLVTFTLTKTNAGTHLRVEQSGFPANMPQAFNGAKFGWTRFFENLDQLLAREN